MHGVWGAVSLAFRTFEAGLDCHQSYLLIGRDLVNLCVTSINKRRNCCVQMCCNFLGVLLGFSSGRHLCQPSRVSIVSSPVTVHGMYELGLCKCGKGLLQHSLLLGYFLGGLVCSSSSMNRMNWRFMIVQNGGPFEGVSELPQPVANFAQT